MNPIAMSLAQAHFQAALNSGHSAAPVALSQLLAQLSADSQFQVFDAEPIVHSTGDEFPFLRNMIASGTPPDLDASAAWEGAVSWVLNVLRNWDTSEKNSLHKLRALLSAVTALDANSAGISCIASQVTSHQLIADLRRLIESSDVAPWLSERRFPEHRRQIESLVNCENLNQLGRMVPHMNLFPVPDLCAAVVFMYSAEPSVLASIIEKRNDILFSLTICTILETRAIALATRVNNLIFKFVSVVNLRQDPSSGTQLSLQSPLQTLLLQVAQTPSATWSAWMQALFSSPGNNASLDSALAVVLQQLSPDHWTSFFKALSLNYSHKTAAPVANILIPFANSTNVEGKTLMWATAYQVWADWSYGQHESDRAMFAPAACALDFPVAMYYASQPSDERLTVERNLLEAIEAVEQQWFNSVTDLVTERNRLKSRLRLVQHGTELANGSPKVLPPDVQPDADLYARTRYYFYNNVK
jgi:hypothetical protein